MYVVNCSAWSKCGTILLAGKTMRTPTRTAITLSRLRWTEIKRYWAARTTTKRLRGPRITPRRVRLYSLRRTRGCSPFTDWPHRLARVLSRYRVRIQYTTIILCTRPYWTLCRPTWSTLAPKMDFVYFEGTLCVRMDYSQRTITWTEEVKLERGDIKTKPDALSLWVDGNGANRKLLWKFVVDTERAHVVGDWRYLLECKSMVKTKCNTIKCLNSCYYHGYYFRAELSKDSWNLSGLWWPETVHIFRFSPKGHFQYDFVWNTVFLKWWESSCHVLRT